MQSLDMLKQNNLIQLPALESDMGVSDQTDVCIHLI